MINPFLFDDRNFGIPHLIIFGKCDMPSCGSTANQFCGDCNFVELCSACYQTTLDRSEVYRAFMDDADKFTCIYCFIELQHEELYNRNKSFGADECDFEEPLRW